MTLALSSAYDRPDRDSFTVALISPCRHMPGGMPTWPVDVRCDLIDLPLEACCGVIAHLERGGVGLCPVAQIGTRMLFLTAEDSGVTRFEPIHGLSIGWRVHGAVADFPPVLALGSGASCWVIEPERQVASPPADQVLKALVSAYAEYRQRSKPGDTVILRPGARSQ